MTLPRVAVQPRALVTVMGSGPFGESTHNSHFWAVDELPAELGLNVSATQPSRRDLDLGPGGLAFVIDDVVTPEEADALVAVSEACGYSRFAPQIRASRCGTQTH